jgi:hypothetical protein
VPAKPRPSRNGSTTTPTNSYASANAVMPLPLPGGEDIFVEKLGGDLGEFLMFVKRPIPRRPSVRLMFGWSVYVLNQGRPIAVCCHYG